MEFSQHTEKSLWNQSTACLIVLGYYIDQANDEAIRERYKNVLKPSFADIMSDYRNKSAKKARVAGHDFPDDRLDFEAMRIFPPRFVHLDVWDELCMSWNTMAWQKKSEKGRKNRKKVDNDDVISRHTGGPGAMMNTSSSW
ncbi:hypothetical protein Hdeb2414_s0006g00217191 [Helianthus debilis subsp. tardiflorus]